MESRQTHYNFELALQHHQAGRLPEAEQLYRQILSQEPTHTNAIQNMGILASQSGRKEEALEWSRRLIAIKPDSADAYVNLGNALQGLGKFDEAIAAFRKSLALRPKFPQALNNLGSALRAAGQLDEAIAAFREAITANPKIHELYNNLGDTLREKGEASQAIDAYQDALVLNANLPDNYYKIGILLRDKGEFEQSVAAYRQAISLKPANAEAYNSMATSLRTIGRADEAIAAIRRAIAINPAYAPAFNNLGISLGERGQTDEAIAVTRQAIALRPNYFQAYNNLGGYLKDKGQIDEALAAYRQAIALNSTYAEGHCSLGVALKDIGQLDESISEFRQAIAIDPQNRTFGSYLIYTMHFNPDYDGRAIAQEHRAWNRRYAEPLRNQIMPHRNDRDPHRRLRVGFLSPDLHGHPVGLSLAALFDHRDRQQLEIVCYSDVQKPDSLTERLKNLADQWVDVPGVSDASVADRIRRDQIDILVDTTLHTASNRLMVFAREPAPVQLTMLGPPISTGLTTMHYRLTDPYLDPPGQGDADYSETSIRIPNCFWIYQAPSFDIAPNELPAQTKGFVTFGCLNQYSKVTFQAIELWLGILQSVANSRLMLQCQPGHHMDAVAKLFADGGIAAERVRYVTRVPLDEYLRRFHELDICFDPFPFTGHTGSLDALWMGVPTVTLRGRTAVARGGVSLLSNVGLTDWIADAPEQYVSIARQAAGDLPKLRELRSTLRRRMEQSPLTDAPLYAGNVQTIFRQLWEKWCESASRK